MGHNFNAPVITDNIAAPHELTRKMREIYESEGRRPFVMDYAAGRGQNILQLVQEGYSNVLAVDIDNDDYVDID